MWVTSTIFVGPSFALAAWQYAATFRAHHRSAKKLLIALAIFDGILLLGVGGAVIEPIASGILPTRDYLVGVVSPMALIASWISFTSFVNFLRYRGLSSPVNPPLAANYDADSSEDLGARFSGSRPRFTLRELAGLVAAVAAVLAGIAFGFRETLPERAMHISVLESRLKLPEGASDVCIRRGSRGIITFDFAIDEPGFWEWTKSRSGSLESEADNVPIKPIEGSFSILSCSDDPNLYVTHHEITRGWYYSWRKEDRAIQYAYDADHGRAYYNAHFH